MVSLTQDQQAVVTDRDGARVVLAGPGSGKSSTMVAFIKSLLASGVPASKIKAVTFSKEMANSLEKKVGLKGIVSTFHSLGYAICSETEKKPVEPELRYRLMMKLVRKWNLDYKELDGMIARLREDNIPPSVALNSGQYDYGMIRAYEEYERERCREGWMDFSSMLADAVSLLEKNLPCRARYQTQYLIVDEAQDTSNIQWRMMQLLSERSGNITVVGDVSQAIYGFRGAKPEHLLNFETWFPNSKRYYLGLNFRSTPSIVQFVRENAPEDTPKELISRMTAAREVKGAYIGLKMYWTDDAEAESALKLTRSDPINSIILARTNRMVGLLERLCNRYNIRYHLLGKTGFWKQNEVRKAIEALKAFGTSPLESAFNLALPSLESKYAVEDRTERDNDALENLKVLRLIGKDFQMAQDFVVYANKMIHRRNDPHGVTISTVHQSKGGEWKNVYIIGASAKGFPHPKGDAKEERRIWFVAISRAIDNLRISFAGTPSCYLRRYLTEEIMDKLREHATEVDHLQDQTKLFA